MAVVTTISHSFTEYSDGIQFSGKATAAAFDLPPNPLTEATKTQAQGTVSGYTSGGGTPASTNTIDKFNNNDYLANQHGCLQFVAKHAFNKSVCQYLN